MKRSISYDPSEIKTILVKRTDRIGDAVVSLPLLLELNKHFKITILASEYNNFFLKKLFETKVFTEKPLNFNQSIKMLSNSLLTSFQNKKDNTPQYDLFLDLSGLRELDIFLKIKKDNLCKYYISFNMGIWNRMLDYAHPGYPVLFSKKHILDSYKELISGALDIDIDIPDCTDVSDKMEKPNDFNGKGFILVNISGIEKFRGPSSKMYAEIINEINFNGEFVIMDELERPHFEEFKKYIKKGNIIYLDREFSLWELLYISSKSKLYLGSDSGISHLLQIPTNAILFFGNPPQEVWRPYSKNPYRNKTERDIIIEETKTSSNLIKKIIYGRAWCRPCFDFGCQKPQCLSFSRNIVTSELNSTIKELFQID
ncbi:MAG: hypothetical protein AABY84_11475 [Candidatus Firestonebacteria bacterium]